MRSMRHFADRCRLFVLPLVVAAGLVTPLGAAPTAEQQALGRELADRFEVRDLDESILLRPRAADSEVRSIEITEDDDLLVNGREVGPDDLDGLLGEDAEAVRGLFELRPGERREALGFWSDRPEPRRPSRVERSGAGRVEVDVPVGPGHIRVRGSGDDRVSVGRSIKLEKGERAGAVVCIGCSVEIEGETDEDAVAVGGSVRVSGTVGGSAVAVGGRVLVEDGGVVSGDGVSVGGSADTEGSGVIEGQISSVGIGGPFFGGWSDGWGFPWSAFGDVSRFVSALVRTGVLALLAVLAVLMARGAVDTAAARIAVEPWKAAFAGLLAQLLFLPVLVLVIVVLAVSIIGIPLLVLVPFALLALVVANFLGFVGVARVFGGGAERRFGWSASSVALSVAVGVVLVQALSLAGRGLSIAGGWLAIAGFTLVSVGFFVKYLAWTMGLGAVTLAALSGDWRRPRPMAPVAPPVAPPPAPSAIYEPSVAYSEVAPLAPQPPLPLAPAEPEESGSDPRS